MAVPQPSQPPAMTSMPLVEPPKFSGLKDLQSPEVSLGCLDSFCLVSGIDEAKRLSNVVPAALEGSAELWRRFVGAFASCGEFAQAFCRDLLSTPNAA
ncbi:hypothetical protein HPB52_022472 [Rhipicephalus sanguineus]|uniref:Uncharacterized protein n=1 Tax=Rhipicephalus sanguineus TaxID=34632 RepID=A0A9D4T0V0_RHISA|nr:hypothetical protein HPB52_022472 [Rhipicephalus sanguineus]